MTSIFVNFKDDWFQGENLWVRGTAFVNNTKITQKDLASWASQISHEDLAKELRSANGFFSAVYSNGTKGWMAVDKIRSFPIFYGQKNGQLFISDDAHWVKEHVGDTEYDPIAKTEFLLTGYVTGADTLYPDVKQVQAGEVIYFKIGTHGEITFEPVRYYRYIHHDYFEKTEEELLEIFDDCLLKVFNRLIDFANGRTIVVPLSGGYDSRLIVLMLKRMGYEKVIAFSYGKEGNEEARVSKEVASQLRIPWEFVPYTNEKWYEWYHSEEMDQYRKMADGCCALPHIQDWPAVKELKESGRIPKDAVFVPGLSADLPAGSRSKKFPHLYKQQTFDKKLFLEASLKFHYSLFDWSKQREELQPLFEERILRSLGSTESFIETAGAFEAWDIAERQAKYINNSIRVYEFFSYDWWTPFWDDDFICFFSKTSPQNRDAQNLYVIFLRKLSRAQRLIIADPPPLKNVILRRIKKVMPSFLRQKLKTLYKAISLRRFYEKNSMCWYGIWKYTDFQRKFTSKKKNIISLLVEEHLS
jgi:asparagine synthase (glutamine-hydrolysing)